MADFASKPSETFADGEDSVLDMQAIERLRELQRPGRPSLLGRVIDLFVSRSPTLIGEMDQAVSTSDWQALRHAAHTLKSTAANLGADSMAKLCNDVETAARTQEKTSEVPEQLGELKTIYTRVESELLRIPRG